MIVQHKELAAGRWDELRLIEQMANIGSEVERALNWREKNNPERSSKAFDRALELLDLTLDCPRNRPRLKEIARTREVCVDFFRGENEFSSSGDSLRKYFLQFACAARRGL
jgi:hypothetical protein